MNSGSPPDLRQIFLSGFAPKRLRSGVGKPNGGGFTNIDRPISGPTHEKTLAVDRHPLNLYSLGTPNGVKVMVMLEELLALGHSGAEHDAWLTRIGRVWGDASEARTKTADTLGTNSSGASISA